MKKIRMVTAVAALVLAGLPVLAHEGEEHGQATQAQAMPAAEALVALQSGMATIAVLVLGGKDGIHEEIEKLEQGPIAALQADASVPPEKKTRLAASLKQLVAELGKVHDAADKKDAAAARGAAKKAAAALKLVESILH